MKSNKTSQKTAQIADKSVAAPIEQLSKEPKQVKRTTKSSTAAKSSTPKSAPHRHSKLSVPATPVVEQVIAVVAAPAPSLPEVVVAPVAAKPSPEEVARLAHSFWVERNFAHGFAEEDWLRAEKALSAAAH